MAQAFIPQVPKRPKSGLCLLYKGSKFVVFVFVERMELEYGGISHKYQVNFLYIIIIITFVACVTTLSVMNMFGARLVLTLSNALVIHVTIITYYTKHAMTYNINHQVVCH